MAGEKILIADDEPHIRKLLERYLDHHGYVVGLAADGLEALELVRQQTPDLVITDVNMPNMNGLELTRRLKSEPRTAGIPIVACTAAVMDSDEERALEAGCDAFLAKPIDMRHFSAIVSSMLA